MSSLSLGGWKKTDSPSLFRARDTLVDIDGDVHLPRVLSVMDNELQQLHARMAALRAACGTEEEYHGLVLNPRGDARIKELVEVRKLIRTVEAARAVLLGGMQQGDEPEPQQQQEQQQEKEPTQKRSKVCVSVALAGLLAAPAFAAWWYTPQTIFDNVRELAQPLFSMIEEYF